MSVVIAFLSSVFLLTLAIALTQPIENGQFTIKVVGVRVSDCDLRVAAKSGPVNLLTRSPYFLPIMGKNRSIVKRGKTGKRFNGTLMRFTDVYCRF